MVHPSPIAPVASPFSKTAFARAQVADQPRLPWAWRAHGKTNAEYTPVVSGKWWSREEEELSGLGPAKRRDFGHIGRIMETELGEMLVGRNRCTACQEADQECWVYSKMGSQQVSRPGDSCARCRVAARPGGCSHSKRKRKSPKDSPAPNRPVYQALGPSGGPPPGTGSGDGIAGQVHHNPQLGR